MYTAEMYTGRLIQELMATVERVEKKVEQQKMDRELHEIFAMQIAGDAGEQIFQGAA